MHGVAVKPGHPVVLGAAHGTPVLGAPGYPVSAALTFDIFAAPLLARAGGRRAARAAGDHARGWRASSPRRWARTTGCGCGSGASAATVVATPLPRGAGVLTSLVRADGLLVVPAGARGPPRRRGRSRCACCAALDEIERTIVAIGSHDLILDLAASALRQRDPRVTLASSNVGSLGGLIALRDGLCHLAGSHLLDPGDRRVHAAVRRPAARPAATSRSCGSCTASRG